MTNHNIPRFRIRDWVAYPLGLLMAGLIAIHWYNAFPNIFNKSLQTIIIIINLAILLIDLSAITGFFITWNNKPRGGWMMLTAIIARIFCLSSLTNDLLTISSACLIGLITAIVILLSYNKQIKDSGDNKLNIRIENANFIRKLARIDGILMTWFMAVHVYNWIWMLFSYRTDEFVFINNIVIAILELLILIGFIVAWKHEHSGGLIIFAASVSRLVWLSFTPVLILSLILSFAFLLSHYLRIEQTERESKTFRALEFHLLAKYLFWGGMIRYIMSFEAFFQMPTELLPKYVFLVIVTLCCVAGRFIMQKKYYGGMLIYFTFTFVFSVWVTHMSKLIPVAIVFILSGIFHFCAWLILKPKPIVEEDKYANWDWGEQLTNE